MFSIFHIINTQIRMGEFPDIWKIEQVTPIPSVYPTIHRGHLRKISIFKQFGKVAEKVFFYKWL